MEKKEKITFPNGFFTQSRPHVKNEKKLDNKAAPFKWSKNVLKGKSEVKIVKMEK